MLLDVLNSNNYLSINISMIKILGLVPAVYCSELLSIYSKAITKNKLNDKGYFKLNRNYVANKTTILEEEQLTIEDKWIKEGLIQRQEDNLDNLKLDVDMLLSILSCEDEKKIKTLTNKLMLKSKTASTANKKVAICENIKKGIVCSNDELLNALKDWVDAIYANPKGGYLTKASVKTFQDTLNNYTQGDLDMALKIVQIATIQGYKMCDWAIRVYENENKLNRQSSMLQSRLPRVTQQEVADELSDDLF